MNLFAALALKPITLYRLCKRAAPWLMGGGIACLIWGMYSGLFVVPADYQQQDAFRMIYVHVPTAFFSMGLFMALGVLSAIYLIWKVKLADMLCVCIAPVGAVMTAIALITGSIWGKPMWGTWWIWDARLTSELILFFLYCAYMGLYHALPQRKVAQKICAILAVVGLIDLPIIHFSVNWWFTLHQGATFITTDGPKIHASMMGPFFGMMVGCLLLISAVVANQLRLIMLEREHGHKWVQSLREYS